MSCFQLVEPGSVTFSLSTIHLLKSLQEGNTKLRSAHYRSLEISCLFQEENKIVDTLIVDRSDDKKYFFEWCIVSSALCRIYSTFSSLENVDIKSRLAATELITHYVRLLQLDGATKERFLETIFKTEKSKNNTQLSKFILPSSTMQQQQQQQRKHQHSREMINYMGDVFLWKTRRGIFLPTLTKKSSNNLNSKNSALSKNNNKNESQSSSKDDDDDDDESSSDDEIDLDNKKNQERENIMVDVAFFDGNEKIELNKIENKGMDFTLFERKESIEFKLFVLLILPILSESREGCALTALILKGKRFPSMDTVKQAVLKTMKSDFFETACGVYSTFGNMELAKSMGEKWMSITKKEFKDVIFLQLIFPKPKAIIPLERTISDDGIVTLLKTHTMKPSKEEDEEDENKKRKNNKILSQEIDSFSKQMKFSPLFEQRSKTFPGSKQSQTSSASKAPGYSSPEKKRSVSRSSSQSSSQSVKDSQSSITSFFHLNSKPPSSSLPTLVPNTGSAKKNRELIVLDGSDEEEEKKEILIDLTIDD